MSVIKIENLWKEYRLGVIGHGTLTHDLQSWWARVRSKEDPNRKIHVLAEQENQIDGDRFWALRDINLECEEGEIIGIIGKNGAGKSTLLKILSRVTAPTSGNIKVKGRIASLLEVGTGFHPELTGQENIFMNGAILGMSKQEIRSKFDEIVDFSGVENFINTPVKRYSSGMYVRLAFAVAAHLEPEILIVDEVLAVGDVEFQKKCLGKMGEVARGGRTVLFVSHNMGSIGQLCNKCMLLSEGKVSAFGETSGIIQSYLFSDQECNGEKCWDGDTKMPGDESLKLSRVTVLQSCKKVETIAAEDKFIIEIETVAPHDISDVMIGVVIKDARGIEIVHSSTIFFDSAPIRKAGRQVVQCIVPAGLLNIGRYSLSVIADIPNRKTLFQVIDLLSFTIEMTSHEMGRYKLNAWKGATSPISVGWSFKEN